MGEICNCKSLLFLVTSSNDFHGCNRASIISITLLSN